MENSNQSSDTRQIFVLYGSQTGQAEAIATEIHESAVFESYNAKIFCLKEEGKSFNIKDVNCAIFVCSTTGDGEPPENARKFLRVISRKTVAKDFLSHLHYALLGLGDTNYSTYCGGPKHLEKQLKAHGANCFYPTGFADDAVGLEEVVEPWIDDLFPALKSHLMSKSIKEDDGFACDVTKSESNSDSKFSGVINGSSNLTSDFSKLNVNSQSEDSNIDKNKSNHALAVKDGLINKIILDDKAICSSSILKSTNLVNSDLSIPLPVPCYLEVQFDDSSPFDLNSCSYQNNSVFPVASSDIFDVHITSVKQLSRDDAVKRSLEIKLGCEELAQYQPGDSFGLCCPNDPMEVNWLIHRLSLNEVADASASFKIRLDTSKKNPTIPAHIPQPFTIRHALTTCIEIRSVPKKPLVRVLAECTSETTQKRRLQELCSKQGANEYTELIRAPNVSVMDLLAIFPSCKPSFSLLAQHLPRLQPRRYSIASSCIKEPNQLAFVFNVVRFNAEHGRTFNRNGVCTGFLEQFISNTNDSGKKFSPLKIFLTKSTGFNLPADMSVPIIMIGPGTGVAPFIGFLEHRAAIEKNLGESWLFYGCRHKERDFLYEDKLKEFEKNGILTHLIVAFSRDISSASPRYVQDNLRLHKTAIVDLLLNKNAIFYVCGDAKNMAKDVRHCFVELIASECDCCQSDANDKFKQVLTEKRYREDIWT